MKRAFLFLVMLIAGYYGYESCVLYNKLSPLVYVEKGNLTEFAERVIPVVLDTAGGPVIENPEKLKREGGNLYFVSENILYRFSDKGEFLSQITSPDNILVADYLIDTYNNQLIVFGNQDDVWYYSLQGKLQRKMKFPKDEEYSRLRSVAYHQNRVWVLKDRLLSDKKIGKVIVEYDTALFPLNTYTVEMAASCHKPELFTFLNPQFSVAPDTGEIYIYNSSEKPEYLLRDTLLVRNQRLLFQNSQNEAVQVYPMRLGSRFYIASRQTQVGEDTDSYFYCFDDKKNKGWCMKDGIKDDVYKTGQITHIQAMDLTGNSYYYVKSGKELTNHFPEIAERNIPVVFIVEMKS